MHGKLGHQIREPQFACHDRHRQRPWLKAVSRVRLIAALSAFTFMGCVTAATPSPDALRQPIQVAVVSAPEDTNDSSLVHGTWALAGATFVLCLVTGYYGRKQAREAQRQIDAANAATELAKRQYRDELEKEADSASQRTQALASRIKPLIAEVPNALGAILSPSIALDQIENRQNKLAEVEAQVAAAVVAAGTLVGSIEGGSSDAVLLRGIREMTGLIEKLTVIREELTAELNNYVAETYRRRQEHEARLIAAGLGYTPKS